MADKVLSPSKLAHVVLRTNNLERMKRFYCQFLGGNIIHENEHIAFISYDEEHHRIALLAIPSLKDKDYDCCGLEHVAFTFDTLKDLCTAYKQRKALGIEPGWCVVSLHVTAIQDILLTTAFLCDQEAALTSLRHAAESRSHDIDVLS